MKLAGVAFLLCAAAATTSLVTACGKSSALDPPEPSLTLNGDEVVLIGPKPRTVVRRADLPPDEVRAVEPIRKSLEAYYQNSRESELTVTLDRELETPRALSVILTAAHAGFYRKIRVRAGATSFSTMWWIAVTSSLHRYIDRMFLIDVGGDGTSSVSLHGRRCAGTAPVKARDAEIPTLLARLCSETPPYTGGISDMGPEVTRCFDAVDIRVPASARFGAVADFVSSVVATFPRLRVPQQREIEVAVRVLRTPDIRERQPTTSQLFQEGPTTNTLQYCTLPDGGYEEGASLRELEKYGPGRLD